MDYAWTCGECGEMFAASGGAGDITVMRWRAEHKEEHRRARLTPEERAAEHAELAAARFATPLNQAGLAQLRRAGVNL